MLAALEAFGARGYEGVAVAELARAAETTTGPLYHHFGSKLGLYDAIRTDVERRVLDRMEGALAAASRPRGGERRAGRRRSTTRSGRASCGCWVSHIPSGPAIPWQRCWTTTSMRLPLGRMLAAAWRAALAACADGAEPAAARRALRALTDRPVPKRENPREGGDSVT